VGSSLLFYESPTLFSFLFLLPHFLTSYLTHHRCHCLCSSTRLFVVYDITDQGSFDNVKQWLQELDRYACENAGKLIVGNKTDLATQRAVDTRIAVEYCAQLGLELVETSARNNTNVDEMFVTMVRLVKDRVTKDLSGVGPHELLVQLEGLEEDVGALNLSHNQLQRVPTELLRFTRLTSLDLSHNQLTDLPLGLFRLPRLNCLELDGNPLPSELRHPDFAAAASAMATRCCRATVRTVLLIRKYRQSVFDNLNRDAMLMVCGDVWSTRYDRWLWLSGRTGEATSNEDGHTVAGEREKGKAAGLPSEDKGCTLQ
jgi:hypothetical protein